MQYMNQLTTIAKGFSSHHILWGLLATILILLLWRLYLQLWIRPNHDIFLGADGDDKDKNRRRAKDLKVRRTWIEERAFERIYFRLLGRFLRSITRFIGDQESLNASVSRNSWQVRLFGLDPFTEGSYVLCLRLALIYPIAGFFIGWLLSDTGGEILGLVLLPPIEEWPVRLLLFAQLVLMVWAGKKLIETRKWYYLLIASIIPTAVALTILLNDAGKTVFPNAFVSKIDLIKATLVIIVSSIAIAYGIGFVISRVITHSSIVEVLTPSIAYVGFATSTVAGANIIDMAVLYFAGGYLFLIWWHRERVYTREEVAIYWVGFSFIAVGCTVATLIWASTLTPEYKSMALLLPVFLVILPLVNAVLDWISLGFTRGLLYAIRRGHHSGFRALGWGFLDFLLALVFLFSIASLTTLLLAGMNAATVYWGGGFPLLDLPLLFDELILEPWSADFWWIHVMMLSTLVPTLVHFFLAGFSVVLIALPNRTRQRILDDFDERDDARRKAWLYVSSVPLLAFAVPVGFIGLLYTLVSLNHGWLGMRLLEWVYGIAALVDPCIGVIQI